jgi:hypothetical protein
VGAVPVDVPVRGRAQRHGSQVGIVWARRLGPGDQLDVGPQLRGIDLHEVVALLPERAGSRPVAVGGDVQQGDPHAHVLDVGDRLREVFFRADHHHVADGLVPRQGREVAVNLALDAFPAPRPHLGHPELDPGQIGERVMIGGPPPLHGRLVPVAAQQRQPGTLRGEVAEQLQQARVIPGHRLTAARTVHRHGTVR